MPAFNVLNGGLHSGSPMPFQEIMIIPEKAKDFNEAMLIGSEVYMSLKKVITQKYGLIATGVGDEGGFAPQTSVLCEALDLLEAAISLTDHKGKIVYAIDAAASGILNIY